MYDKIKELLKERGMSQTELCRATGISRVTVRKWKTNGVRLGTVRKIADFFGVPVGYFLE